MADIDAAVHLDHSVGVCHSRATLHLRPPFIAQKRSAGRCVSCSSGRRSQRLTPGNWMTNRSRSIGGLISEQAAQQVVTAWQQLEAMGRRPLLAPRLLQSETSLLTPGIIEMTGVAGVPDEEVFGPLLRVWRYDSFEEAILMANNTRFGLSCCLVSPERKKLINCCWRRGRGSLTGTNRLLVCQYRAIRRHWCIR
ncbi:aldehyde dehydrogenase family protein [Escherichia coli]